jgi:cellulase
MAGRFALATLLPLLASAQGIGKDKEVHPKLPAQKCTKHGCTTVQSSVVLDSGTHWIYNKTSGANCDPSVCTTEAECAKACAVDGISDYASHGVQTNGNALTLHQYLNINGTETTVSPRVYLLDSTGKNYEALKLLNQEFTFTVDLSNLPCGMNGALYLSAMSPTGGRSALNPAGAAYGTGYCDAQCPKEAWINGEANVGSYGACCNEMDIWEANARATALTPHACNITGLTKCLGDDCTQATGFCDEWGCSYNPYGQGDTKYYGLKGVVDTTQPFTVVTQFNTDDKTAHGTLDSISRLYVQHGKVVKNDNVTFGGQPLLGPTVCPRTERQNKNNTN